MVQIYINIYIFPRRFLQFCLFYCTLCWGCGWAVNRGDSTVWRSEDTSGVRLSQGLCCVPLQSITRLMGQPASGSLPSLPPSLHGSTDITDLPHSVIFWRFKLRSSHLYPKSFTSWAISLLTPLWCDLHEATVSLKLYLKVNCVLANIRK